MESYMMHQLSSFVNHADFFLFRTKEAFINAGMTVADSNYEAQKKTCAEVAVYCQ